MSVPAHTANMGRREAQRELGRDDVAQPKARHGIALREPVEDEDVASQGQRGPLVSVVAETAVDLIRDHNDLVRPADRGEIFDFLLAVTATAGVIGIVEDQNLLAVHPPAIRRASAGLLELIRL